MPVDRRVVLATVAALAACGGGGSQTFTPTSVPPNDGGAPPADLAGPTGSPDDGMDPGSPSGVTDGGATACSTTAEPFALDFRLGTSDGVFVYGFTPTQLVRVPLAGGAPQVLVDGIHTDIDSDLVVDDQWAYWFANDLTGSFDNFIIRAPKNGGEGKPIGAGDLARALIVAGDRLYFFSYNALWTLPRTGGYQHSRLVENAGQAVTDGASLWYTDLDTGALKSVALVGGAGATFGAVVTFDQAAQPLAVDDQLVYRSEAAGVTRTSKTTGETATLLALPAPSLLRVSGGYVYAVVGNEHALWRVARDGSSPTHLTDRVGGQFLVAGDSVYFTLPSPFQAHRGDTYRICK